MFVLALAFRALLLLAAAVPQVALGGSLIHRIEQDHLGAVASENSVCSRIGIDLLKVGGNAADAVSL